jgi:RHO1 GDP-GTP exchange protein 1/2
VTVLSDRNNVSLTHVDSSKSGRSNYSQANVDRNNSIVSSMSTNGDTVMIRHSSSLATTIEDDYFGSAKFLPTPGPSGYRVLDEKAALNFPDTVESTGMSDESLEQPLNPEEFDEDDIHDTDSEGDDRYVDFSQLSHIAMRLRDKVPRETHVKGSIPYPRAFTGKDIVVSIYFSFL